MINHLHCCLIIDSLVLLNTDKIMKIAYFYMTSNHTQGRSNYVLRTFRYTMTNGQSRKFLHFCIIPINSLVNDFAGSG